MKNEESLAFATIEELAALLAKRKISPVELTEHISAPYRAAQSLAQRLSDRHGGAGAGRGAPCGKEIASRGVPPV
jgi:hypothetical protein